MGHTHNDHAKTGAEAHEMDRERELDPEVDDYFREEADLRGER